MQWKEPKNDSKYEWTEHSKYKMRHYGLSPQRVLRVIKSPKRTETGIVEKTIAVMQPGGNIKKGPGKSKWGKFSFGNNEDENVSADGKSWSSEIWVMYQLRRKVGASDKLQMINDKKNSRSEKIQELKTKISNSSRKIRIISAWRYPGVTDENDPIPAEIMREIEEII